MPTAGRVYDCIDWIADQGSPNSDEGKHYEIYLNEWGTHEDDHPAVRSGHKASQFIDEADDHRDRWRIRITRGSSTGKQCVLNAYAEMKLGSKHLEIAMEWLCAGQAHNKNERKVLRADAMLTFKQLRKVVADRRREDGVTSDWPEEKSEAWAVKPREKL